MFERFTKGAHAAVLGAVRHAEQVGDPEVEPAHLLLGMVDSTTSAAATLRANGLTRQSVAVEVAKSARRAGLSQEDITALGRLGIDVQEVVDRVERAHGRGVLRAASGKRIKHRRFTAAAKTVLRRALREAADLRDKHIGEEHLLLALAAESGIPREIMAKRGLTYRTLRASHARAS